MQFTNKDIIKFNKLFQTRLPHDLKNKFVVKLYHQNNSYHPCNDGDELALEGTQPSDHYLTLDNQPDYQRDDIKNSDSLFATISFNSEPSSKQYLMQLDGFSYLISYGEIDEILNYTFDEARNIMTAIIVFIDTAKEFFN